MSGRVEIDWRYTPTWASGRPRPTKPLRKHALRKGADAREGLSLCNRQPYWRLPEPYRRWMGTTGEEAAVLAELEACQACTAKLAVILMEGTLE